jgi:DNA-directed RNA polymerase-3 subunit RPC5
MRLKPKSGMVELDVPTNIIDSYDREKGMRWGRVLQESLLAKSGGSHGLAGGFGVGAPQQRGRRREDSEISDWSEEVKHGRVLHTQTLGGHSPNARFVKHMIGVFQDGEAYLNTKEASSRLLTDSI